MEILSRPTLCVKSMQNRERTTDKISRLGNHDKRGEQNLDNTVMKFISHSLSL